MDLLRQTGIRLVEITVGGILISAAALKGFHTATEPTIGTHIFDSRWVHILTVQLELALGLWLFSRWHAQQARLTAIGLFALFTVVTASKALAGDSSCGCFGPIDVSPWVTGALDTGILTALIFTHPWRKSQTDALTAKRQQGRMTISVIAVTVLIVGAGLTLHRPPVMLDATDPLDGSDFVFLDPPAWIGKTFPLADHLEIGGQLMAGEWFVVFYRHDCSHCLEELPGWLHLGAELVHQRKVPSLALIQVPPFGPPGTDPVPPQAPCERSRLANTKDWFIQTPAAIELNGGIVTDGELTLDKARQRVPEALVDARLGNNVLHESR